jgi:hypothetical protein
MDPNKMAKIFLSLWVGRKESKNCESGKEAVPKVRGKGWQKETKTILVPLAL